MNGTVLLLIPFQLQQVERFQRLAVTGITPLLVAVTLMSVIMAITMVASMNMSLLRVGVVQEVR